VKFKPCNPNNKLISSAQLDVKSGHHAIVRLWNRGALAGELVLDKADGYEFLMRLGLEQEDK
jgi:hypothetical protein